MPTSKCFLRYNNSGNRYKVCIDPSRKDAPDKVWDASMRKQGDKKAKEPLITTEEYIEKVVGKGKGYTDLKTKEQRRGYHRVDMANRRQKQRLLEEKAIKDLKGTQKELKEELKKTIDEIKKQKGSGVKLKKGQAEQDIGKIVSQAIKDYKEGKEVDEVKLKKLIGEEKFKNQYKQFAISQEEIMAKQAKEKEERRAIVRAQLKQKIRNINKRIEEDKKEKSKEPLKKIKRAKEMELDRVGYDALKLLEGANINKRGVPKPQLKKLLDSRVGNPKLQIGQKTYKDLKYAGSETIRFAINRNPILKKAFIRAEQNNNRFLSNNNKPPQN